MSAKTKIVVLHMKSIILTGMIIGLGLLLLLFIFTLRYPLNEKSKETKETAYYTPGIYTSCLMLGEETVNVAVTVDENHINSVEIVNLSDSVATMYPLVKPAMEDISNQIINNQSTDDITYSKSNQYTSIVLLDAVNDALSKAKIRAT
ncbi:MAG: hypothetical protein UH963_00495 [Agathobacter sp.]|nr:hypothetical protein [Agathobacter sp.]